MRHRLIVLVLVLLTIFLGSEKTQAADKEEIILDGGHERTIAYAGNTTYYRIHNNGPGKLFIIAAPLQGAPGEPFTLAPGASIDIAKPNDGKLTLRAQSRLTAWYVFLGI